MSTVRLDELVDQALVRYAQPPVPRLPVAVFCADPNPWDAAILCALPDGHSPQLLHEGQTDHGWPTRWADRCHFPGDACGPDAHPAPSTPAEGTHP